MRVLIVEDWWADRLRFEYLLEGIPGIETDFAWTAGRMGGVWPIEEIVAVAHKYDRLIIDLALTRGDEEEFRKAHEWTDEEFSRDEDVLDDRITGLRLLQSLSAKDRRGQNLTSRCIVASAHVYDRLRDHCITHWGITDTFHKWSDEGRLVRTLYDIKLRSKRGRPDAKSSAVRSRHRRARR